MIALVVVMQSTHRMQIARLRYLHAGVYVGARMRPGEQSVIRGSIEGFMTTEAGIVAKNPRQLTKKQLEILVWIRDGCPPGVYEQGYTHRIIARALVNRGLVTISGHGDSWEANITAAGITWLDSPPAEVLPESSEADQLLQQVLDAGGVLEVSVTDRNDKTYDRLVRMSMKSASRPFGKRLEISAIDGWYSNRRRIALAEYFEDRTKAHPVPVPGRVHEYHPAVKAYLGDKEWHFVTQPYLNRAARILQAIAAEAERRSLNVVTPSAAVKKLDEYKAREIARTHLAIVTPSGIYGIKVKEIPDKGGQKLKPRYWNEPKRLPAWLDSRGWEFISTGRLELRVFGPMAAYGGDAYRDAKSKRLEDMLPEVFRSFDIYALKIEARERVRELEEERKQRHWEQAIEAAKVNFAADFRWRELQRQAADWRRAHELHDYIAAMRDTVAAETPSESTTRWLGWAESAVKGLDPLAELSSLEPNIPHPTTEQLKPFLGGLSPYSWR